ADVNPDHHVKILEALIIVGGLTEIQAAPGRQGRHPALVSESKARRGSGS
ncbi:phosphoinositide-3-kinase, regulatory subunit 3b (gamma) isoform X1, partial [Tachysurus ichikawai]